jgi:Fe2+ transport system protein FeoA
MPRLAPDLQLLVEQRHAHVGICVQRIRRQCDLVVAQGDAIAPDLLFEGRQVEIRLEVIGLERDRAFEALARWGAAALVEVDRAQIAVGVGEARIRLNGRFVGLDGLAEGRAIGVEAAAPLEPFFRSLQRRRVASRLAARR